MATKIITDKPKVINITDKINPYQRDTCNAQPRPNSTNPDPSNTADVLLSKKILNTAKKIGDVRIIKPKTIIIAPYNFV